MNWVVKELFINEVEIMPTENIKNTKKCVFCQYWFDRTCILCSLDICSYCICPAKTVYSAMERAILSAEPVFTDAGSRKQLQYTAAHDRIGGDKG